MRILTSSCLGFETCLDGFKNAGPTTLENTLKYKGRRIRHAPTFGKHAMKKMNASSYEINAYVDAVIHEPGDQAPLNETLSDDKRVCLTDHPTSLRNYLEECIYPSDKMCKVVAKEGIILHLKG